MAKKYLRSKVHKYLINTMYIILNILLIGLAIRFCSSDDLIGMCHYRVMIPGGPSTTLYVESTQSECQTHTHNLVQFKAEEFTKKDKQ